MPESKVNTERVVITILACTMGAMIYTNSKQDATPPSNAEVVKISHESMVQFAVENAAMRRAMAKALRSGKVETDVEYLEWFQGRQQAAMDEAFGDFRSAENAALKRKPDDDFDTEAAAEFCESVAEGFEKVK